MNVELGVLVGLGLVAIVYFIVRFGHKPKPPSQTMTAPFGVFRRVQYDKNGYYWVAPLEELGAGVTVSIKNEEQAPSEEQLARVPGLTRLVRESDAVARSAMKEYLRDYDPPNPTLELAEVSIDADPNSFELHYATEADEGYDFSIFVTFTDGRVVDVLLFD